MMFNTSLFAERLSDLMFDADLSAVGLAAKLNTTKMTIYRYLEGNRIPTVEMLLRIADFFNVTTDFLIGLKSESDINKFNRCPDFSERFAFLLKKFKVTKYRLEKDTHINEETIYAWLRGKNKPSLENILKLAEYFNCTVDYVLGRE